eukprot:1137870-Pelagomonas_calceolata.AAC.4
MMFVRICRKWTPSTGFPLGVEGGLSGPWGYVCCNRPKARGLQLSGGYVRVYTGAREVAF